MKLIEITKSENTERILRRPGLKLVGQIFTSRTAPRRVAIVEVSIVERGTRVVRVVARNQRADVEAGDRAVVLRVVRVLRVGLYRELRVILAVALTVAHLFGGCVILRRRGHTTGARARGKRAKQVLFCGGCGGHLDARHAARGQSSLLRFAAVEARVERSLARMEWRGRRGAQWRRRGGLVAEREARRGLLGLAGKLVARGPPLRGFAQVAEVGLVARELEHVRLIRGDHKLLRAALELLKQELAIHVVRAALEPVLVERLGHRARDVLAAHAEARARLRVRVHHAALAGDELRRRPSQRGRLRRGPCGPR